jgi:hypothetical protein
MLQEISYYMIFGKPLMMYLGLLVLVCFLTTATIGLLLFRGSTKVNINMHKAMAITSITLAIIHGILGVLLYF